MFIQFLFLINLACVLTQKTHNMNKAFLLFLSIFIFSQVQAQSLLYIPYEEAEEVSSFQNNSELTVNLFGDLFIIATSEVNTFEESIILDKYAWAEGFDYSIVYFKNENKEDYISNLPESNTVCYRSDGFIILKHPYGDIYPATNDGTVRITKNKAHLSKAKANRYRLEATKDADPFIQSLIDEIDITGVEELIQHMENYGTRYYNKPQAFEAEQWIKDQFIALGLETEIHTFPQAGSSGNIIAIQEGTLYPDEYIVCGAHYDTYNNNQNFDDAPGADDNATGVASIIEAARILSQYEFDRSIIYCAWSAEEIGLVGSQYYAEDAAEEELDILGYFNLDMTGYLDSSQDFKFVLHYSHNSELLRDYYINMANIYYPGIETVMSFSSWGSDYASFANNGYMGVSQNEDWSHANPHYHSPTDLIGPSVNNFEQVETYAGLNIASVATLAKSLAVLPTAPKNLVGIKGDQEANLSWDLITNEHLGFNIYRNDEFIQLVEPNTNSFTDTGLENETIYNYYITASYMEDIESEPSNSVEIIPMEPISIPFYTDFEGFKSRYWSFTEGWGLASNASSSPSHSLSDKPTGFYDNDSNTSTYLDPFVITNDNDYYVEFQLKHHLNESGTGDLAFFEYRFENDDEWTIIDSYTGTQSQWSLKSYQLETIINQTLNLRFRLLTDEAGQDFGIFIDDFKIDLNTSIETVKNKQISIYPNPVKDKLYINSDINFSSAKVLNHLGQKVLNISISHNKNHIDVASLKDGIYMLKLEEKGKVPILIQFVKN